MWSFIHTAYMHILPNHTSIESLIGSFMVILAEFGHLADFGGQYTYLAEFVTFVLNMLET